MTSGSEDELVTKAHPHKWLVGSSSCGDDVWIAWAELDADYIAISQLRITGSHRHTLAKLANMCHLHPHGPLNMCRLHTWLHSCTNAHIYVNWSRSWIGNQWSHCIPTFPFSEFGSLKKLKAKTWYMFTPRKKTHIDLYSCTCSNMVVTFMWCTFIDQCPAAFTLTFQNTNMSISVATRTLVSTSSWGKYLAL